MKKWLGYLSYMLLIVIAYNVIQLNNRISFIEELITKAFLSDSTSIKSKSLSIIKNKLKWE